MAFRVILEILKILHGVIGIGLFVVRIHHSYDMAGCRKKRKLTLCALIFLRRTLLPCQEACLGKRTARFGRFSRGFRRLFHREPPNFSRSNKHASLGTASSNCTASYIAPKPFTTIACDGRKATSSPRKPRWLFPTRECRAPRRL